MDALTDYLFTLLLLVAIGAPFAPMAGKWADSIISTFADAD